MPIELKVILFFLCIILIAFYICHTILPEIKAENQKKRKNKYKKKYHTPKNNYFRNNPEHVDMSKSYIDNLWDEFNK